MVAVVLGQVLASLIRFSSSLALHLVALLTLQFFVGAAVAQTFDASADGSKIVFSATDGDLYLLDVSTSRVRQLTRTDGGEGSPAFSPDGTKVAYAYGAPKSYDSTIRQLDLADGTTIDLTKGAGHCDGSPCYSSDGAQILFARAHRLRPYSMGGMTWDDWDVCIMDRDGGNLRRVTNQFQEDLGGVCFTPDEKNVIFSRRAERADGSMFSTIMRAPLSGKEPFVALTPVDARDATCAAMGSEPCISGTGDQLAFISDRLTEFEYEVYLMEPIKAETRPRRLTSQRGYISSPDLAHEAGTVFYLLTKRGGLFAKSSIELRKVSLDGTGDVRVGDAGLFQKPLESGIRQ